MTAWSPIPPKAPSTHSHSLSSGEGYLAGEKGVGEGEGGTRGREEEGLSQARAGSHGM